MPPDKKEKKVNASQKKEISNEVQELKRRIEQLENENAALKHNFDIEKVLAELKKENSDTKDYIISTTTSTLVTVLEEYKKKNTKDAEQKGNVEGLRHREDTQENVDDVAWKQKIEDLGTQVADLTRKNESLEIEQKKQEKEINDLREETNKLKNGKNESVENERKKYEKEIKDLREENNKLKSGTSQSTENGTKTYENKIEELKKQNKKLKDEKNESVENERKKYEKEIKDLREENNKLKSGTSQSTENGTKIYEKDIEELKKQNKKLKDEKNESVENERKKYEKEIKDLREENNKLKSGTSQSTENGTKIYEKDIEELKKQNKKLKDEKNESVENERKKYEKEIKDLREENNKLKSGTSQSTENGTKIYEKDIEELKKQNKKLKDELEAKKTTLSNSNMELIQLQKEVDSLRTRLSEMAGAQMTHNNPNIADLSDANRPTKLSEEYTQVYDNEWTDAYEEMDGEGGTEQTIIKSLLARLMDCFEFCKTTSREFSNKLEESSFALPGLKSQKKSKDIPVVCKKQLQDMKKSFGVLLRDEVKDLYWSKKNSKQEKQKTKNYINKCIELCWLMALQEPPVVIDKEAESSSSFDTDKYRTYTQTGTKIDFVVWPPLRLHEGGALLAKGVAQGIK